MNQYKHQRMRLIDKAERLSIGRQCELVGVSRSNFYYQPVAESELNLELMRLIYNTPHSLCNAPLASYTQN